MMKFPTGKVDGGCAVQCRGGGERQADAAQRVITRSSFSTQEKLPKRRVWNMLTSDNDNKSTTPHVPGAQVHFPPVQTTIDANHNSLRSPIDGR